MRKVRKDGRIMNLSPGWAIWAALEGRKTRTVNGCPFCRSNARVDVLRETANLYLVKARGDNENYLVIPNRHVLQLDTLPQGWGEELAELVAYVRDEVWHSPKEGHYNVSLNVGRRAGRRVNHLHWWVIDRRKSPIDGLGLATLALIERFFPGLIREGRQLLDV